MNGTNYEIPHCGANSYERKIKHFKQEARRLDFLLFELTEIIDVIKLVYRNSVIEDSGLARRDSQTG